MPASPPHLGQSVSPCPPSSRNHSFPPAPVGKTSSSARNMKWPLSGFAEQKHRVVLCYCILKGDNLYQCMVLKFGSYVLGTNAITVTEMASLSTDWTLRGTHSDISGFFQNFLSWLTICMIFFLWVLWSPSMRRCVGKGAQTCLLTWNLNIGPNIQSQVHNWMPRKKGNVRLRVTLTAEHPCGDFRLREGVLLATMRRRIHGQNCIGVKKNPPF